MSISPKSLQVGVTLTLIAAGYAYYRFGGRADVTRVDIQVGEKTRHTVPLSARVDQAALREWLEQSERRDNNPPPAAGRGPA